MQLLKLVSLIMVAALTGAPAAAQSAIAPPDGTAKSVFVINADTGQVLYEKNADEIYRSLSLTKLITAYVLVDHMGGRLSETVEIIGPHLTGGSTAGLKRFDVWTLQDLLYGMVLVSGNDASLAIADYVGQDLLARSGKSGNSTQSTARFVEQMRTTANALGAEHTGFADPYGLSPKNVATARDMGRIAARVFTDDRLLPAWACTTRTVHIEGKKPRTVTLKTSLENLGDDHVIGAKTGSYMTKNIYNLITAWRAPNGDRIVGVVFGANSNPARYSEMRTIMETVPRDFRDLAAATSAAPATPPSSCN